MDVDTDGGFAAARQQAELTRAEGLWFEDCGLIIQADTTLFRISRDFLAAQSTIFKDMLSLPPPSDAEMMDGCPFVLLPDEAEDVTVFFKALLYYDFFEPSPAPTTLAILTGVLRMSHKYEVDAMRKRALLHISSFHPTTLDEYLALADKSAPWFEELDDGLSFTPLIVLARELSLDWIIPATFYRTCEWTAEELIVYGQISKEDQVRLTIGCRMLEATGVTKILDFLWPDNDPECDDPDGCDRSRFSCRRMAEGRRPRENDAQARVPLSAWRASDWKRLKVCDVCMSNMKEKHQRALQSFWDELPSIFRLPPWSELEKLKAEAME
ncbi:hypothetical protein C8R47DRAFT_1027932 [Mycena vitilis]|nr:hypothetical protein C8R47DRAFT_1027932 [Mycena vitilis]